MAAAMAWMSPGSEDMAEETRPGATQGYGPRKSKCAPNPVWSMLHRFMVNYSVCL
jgi:hypothetical protein